MNRARIVALLVVAGMIGIAVWTVQRRAPARSDAKPASAYAFPGGSSTSPAGEVPSPTAAGAVPRQGTPTADPDWDPVGGQRKQARNGPVNPPPAPVVPPDPPAQISDAGTAPAAGTKVSVRPGWKLGPKRTFLYEVTEVLLQSDMQGRGAALVSETQRVKARVLKEDGAGGVRIAVTIDSFTYRSLRADGFPIEFDSRVGDPNLLRDKAAGPALAARLAIVGRPIEFALDAEGRVTDVTGINDWRERWIDAIDRVSPGQGREALDAPTRASVLTTWQEILFPRFGGEFVAGTGRPYGIRYLIPGGWAIVWKGAADVRRDDPDSFRIDATATPSAEPDPSAPQSPDPIAKVNAIGDADAMKAAWRFSRTTGGLLESRLAAKYQVHISISGGTAPGGAPIYNPAFYLVERQLLVRRTAEEE